ncbi:MAG: hypothetical protein OEZ39_02040 [Gammaproteobacteria bacterium]|nr:hypothetical protein [Gammaproteobacteria bacterium]MDH5650635.1 hypothetical protein [Gammaproteobacteria bacterium]
MEEPQGLIIWFDENWYKEEKEIKIDGVLSTFINCCSQYAVWYQFPDIIRFKITDLDTGNVYESFSPDISYTHSGNRIYDMYSKMPCNKVVSKEFSIMLKSLYFPERPESIITDFELTADYCHESNVLIFKDIPLEL